MTPRCRGMLLSSTPASAPPCPDTRAIAAWGLSGRPRECEELLRKSVLAVAAFIVTLCLAFASVPVASSTAMSDSGSGGAQVIVGEGYSGVNFTGVAEPIKVTVTCRITAFVWLSARLQPPNVNVTVVLYADVNCTIIIDVLNAENPATPVILGGARAYTAM